MVTMVDAQAEPSNSGFKCGASGKHERLQELRSLFDRRSRVTESPGNVHTRQLRRTRKKCAYYKMSAAQRLDIGSDGAVAANAVDVDELRAGSSAKRNQPFGKDVRKAIPLRLKVDTGLLIEFLSQFVFNPSRWVGEVSVGSLFLPFLRISKSGMSKDGVLKKENRIWKLLGRKAGKRRNESHAQKPGRAGAEVWLKGVVGGCTKVRALIRAARLWKQRQKR
ncbi:hypothetical protein JOM56_006887 [Amanita muscaria]